jgi:phosphopantothenoylcysteine decarboxylase/phosphopantothenate--cysteine ligase
MLRKKNILLAVTGSIAAYKAANLASTLKKLGANVTVMMTQNATHFIHPLTFETLTGNKCLIDTFDRNFQYQVEHVSLAKSTDLLLVAPASANVIGKLANGLADDMLTTTCLACGCHKIIAPAMNTQMYENPVVQDNLRKLARYGMEVITPDTGLLACGDVGAGKLPSETVLLDHLLRELAFEKDLAGVNVLVTAGPTREKLDPVRYLTNHSTGKMGYSLARNCMLRGAKVTLITGKTALPKPPFVSVVEVESAQEMLDAVKARYAGQDILIKAAAVADYRPAQVFSEKMKKSDSPLTLALERTEDILRFLGDHRRPGQFLCGFSMETRRLLEHSQAKLAQKHADMIVANSLKQPGAGFGTDTNIVTLITADSVAELPLLSKDEAAKQIVDAILECRRKPAGRG